MTAFFTWFAIGGAISAAIHSNWTAFMWALIAATYAWLLNRAEKRLYQVQRDDDRTYRVTVTPERFEQLLSELGSLPPPPDGHYSVGGTRPHMCVCGKPIKEHK